MYINIMNKLAKQARKKEIPFSGMFELTSRCNLRCRFCYVCDRETKNVHRSEKNTDEWLDMIKQATDAGMLKCTFTGGDPFMRDDFEEIYCKSYDMGLRISIFSNGILIGEKQRSFLSKRKPELISISMYGASEKSYHEVCGDGSGYYRIMESLKGIHSAGLAFEIKVLAMRPLISEYEAIGHVAAMYQCQGNFDSYMRPGRDDYNRLLYEWRLHPSEINEAAKSFRKFLPVPKSMSIDRLTDPVNGNPEKCAFYCRAGKSFFFITYDGWLMGCPTLTCFKSDPFCSGFYEAWSSLKEMILQANTCKDCFICPEHDKCFICPAERLSETGSITQCSPYLLEMIQSLSSQDKEAI